jgi:acetyl-CoA synthase
MNKDLKEELSSILTDIGKQNGIEDFFDKIADETMATTEEEVLEFITKKKHPALSMDPLF